MNRRTGRLELSPGWLSGAILGASVLLPGCVVSASRYDAAVAAAEHEAEQRRDTEERLETARHALVDTRARLRATRRELEQTALALSRAEQELAVTTREHETAGDRVAQLQTELERAARNHEVLSERLRTLESTLEALDCEIDYGETTTVDCGELLPEDEDAGESPADQAKQKDDRVADAR